MTGTEIVTLAEHHTEAETIPADFALSIINECILMDLGKDVRAVASVVVMDASEDAWQTLADDVLEIFEITEQGEDAPYWGFMYGQAYRGLFDYKEGKIRFPETGSYTVHYFKVPDAIAALSETPNVHAALHWPMSLYLAARFKSYDDEENPDARRLLGEFYQYRAKVLEDIARTRPSTRAPRRVRSNTWR